MEAFRAGRDAGAVQGLTSDESPIDSTQVPTLLHGNDPQVILLIHPNQERLVIVVENPSSDRPKATRIRCLRSKKQKQNKMSLRALFRISEIHFFIFLRLLVAEII